MPIISTRFLGKYIVTYAGIMSFYWNFPVYTPQTLGFQARNRLCCSLQLYSQRACVVQRRRGCPRTMLLQESSATWTHNQKQRAVAWNEIGKERRVPAPPATHPHPPLLPCTPAHPRQHPVPARRLEKVHVELS